MNNLEQTLSIIKPDAVERNLDNEIKEIFKNKGFSILKEKIDKRFEKENFRCIHCGESDGLSFEDERGFDITDNPYCFECSMYQDEG